jgi:hypothetical protein
MSSRWFRLYDELLDDPKVQRLPADLFKALVNVWCLASRSDGLIPPIEDVAFGLRTTPEKAEKTLKKLEVAGFIDRDGDNRKPHNWNGRQFKSDVSTERVQRYRQRKRNDGETLQATPPETETEADTEQNREEISVPSEPHPARAGLPPDLRHAIEAYNTVAADVGLPLCRALNASRRTKLAMRLKESGLAGWCSAVANLRDSPFCLGQNNRGWKADFDFLLQPKSFGKLLDGAYRYTKPRSAGMQAVLDYTQEVENEGFGGQELRVEGGGDAGRLLPEPSR